MQMMKSVVGMLCCSLGISLAAIGCGDDEDEKKGVSVETPGADVEVKAEQKALEGSQGAAAGSAASAPSAR
jgi:hypothetical protein